MLERFFDEGLAHSSYVIGCERTRQAIVIDPRRDVDTYVAFARQNDFRLSYVVETHIHADFVSGARELTEAGATCVAGPGSDLGFAHQSVRDGDRLAVGDLRLTFLHTPGHTPEHISLLSETPTELARVFTGDTLFVGAVGRPDLLGEEMTRRLASELYDSLYGTLLALDDAVQVLAAHGAGSLCGQGISSEPSSTIGHERRFNPMLHHPSRAGFVAAVLEDLPETPSYFARMKRVNKAGPPLLGLLESVRPPPALTPVAAKGLVDQGAILLDLRPTPAFAAAHPAGALNIPFGSRVGYWAGWVVPPDVPVVLLLADPNDAAEAVRQLLRVGIEQVAGTLDGRLDAWRAAGFPVAALPQLSAAELRARLTEGSGLRVIDVRTSGEWRTRHIQGAVHVPVGEVADRAPELAGSGPVAVICEGGHRSSLAASVLARAGLEPVLNVIDGMSAYQGLTVSSGNTRQ